MFVIIKGKCVCRFIFKEVCEYDGNGELKICHSLRHFFFARLVNHKLHFQLCLYMSAAEK